MSVNYQLHNLFNPNDEIIKYPYLFKAFSLMTLKQIKQVLPKEDYIFGSKCKDDMIMNLIYCVQRKLNYTNVKYRYINYLLSDLWKLPAIVVYFLHDNHEICELELKKLIEYNGESDGVYSVYSDDVDM